MTTFSETFKAATGFDPYPYQVELATRPNLPALVSVPTGCGKTAAVILGWLWRRRLADKEHLPCIRRACRCRWRGTETAQRNAGLEKQRNPGRFATGPVV